MPSILRRRSAEVSIPEADARPSLAIAALLATVDNSAEVYRAGMSHREFRELARERQASSHEAWSPIRSAAHHAGYQN